MTDNKQKVSPASAWRSLVEEGIEVELPNGLVARLRSVSVGFLLKAGKMPSSLLDIAMNAADIDMLKKDGEQLDTSSLLEAMDDYYKVICTEAFVSPRIVDEPKADDEIAFEWLTDHDKRRVDELINLPLVKWKNFRPQHNGSVESVRQD